MCVQHNDIRPGSVCLNLSRSIEHVKCGHKTLFEDDPDQGGGQASRIEEHEST